VRGEREAAGGAQEKRRYDGGIYLMPNGPLHLRRSVTAIREAHNRRRCGVRCKQC